MMQKRFVTTNNVTGLNTATNMVTDVTDMVPLATEPSWQSQNCDQTLLKHRLQTGDATGSFPQFDNIHNLIWVSSIARS